VLPRGEDGDNRLQDDLKKIDGMYFHDSDTARGRTGLTTNDIVGYVHGMIQAIYDVRWRGAGTPYEIAVGKQTTKLASCLTCAIFMEANGFPASSTHLGRGESWCILHPEDLPPNVPKTPPPASGQMTQNDGRVACNIMWADYCEKILKAGIECIEGQVEAKHQASFQALKDYDAAAVKYGWGNLILDAVTVHNGEVKRIIATLSDPPPPSSPPPQSATSAVGGGGSPGTTTSSCATGSIEVTVEKADRDVEVVAKCGSTELRQNATSDDPQKPRKAVFANVAHGKYAISVTYTAEMTSRFHATPAQTVTVESRDKPAKVTFVMERGDWIEITLVNTDKAALAEEAFEIRINGTMTAKRADINGKCRVEQVGPGSCDLRLKRPGEWDQRAVL
jgi:hypothetical protein